MFFLLVERGIGRFFEKKFFWSKSEDKNKVNDNFSIYLHVFMHKNESVPSFSRVFFSLPFWMWATTDEQQGIAAT
jgi:hypothetical protein